MNQWFNLICLSRKIKSKLKFFSTNQWIWGGRTLEFVAIPNELELRDSGCPPIPKLMGEERKKPNQNNGQSKVDYESLKLFISLGLPIRHQSSQQAFNKIINIITTMFLVFINTFI